MSDAVATLTRPVSRAVGVVVTGAAGIALSKMLQHAGPDDRVVLLVGALGIVPFIWLEWRLLVSPRLSLRGDSLMIVTPSRTWHIDRGAVAGVEDQEGHLSVRLTDGREVDPTILSPSLFETTTGSRKKQVMLEDALQRPTDAETPSSQGVTTSWCWTILSLLALEAIWLIVWFIALGCVDRLTRRRKTAEGRRRPESGELAKSRSPRAR